MQKTRPCTLPLPCDSDAAALPRRCRFSAVRRTCGRIAVSSLIAFLALGGWLLPSGMVRADEAAATELPRLASGAKVKDFYELVQSKDDAICRPFLSAVNVEKTYYFHDEREVTLGTPFNLTWDISIPDDAWTVPPTGNWKGHQISHDEFGEGDGWQETLAADLDNDGHTDQVYRWTTKFHSQNHSVLILLDKPAITKSDLKFLGGYQDEHGTRQLRSTERDVLTVETARRLMPGVADFFLMDVAQIQKRNFVLAASMLRAPTRPVDTYVIQLHPDRRLEIICHLQGRYLIR